MEKPKRNNVTSEAPELREPETDNNTSFSRALSELLREKNNITERTFPTVLGDLEGLAKRYQDKGVEEAADIFGRIQDFRENMVGFSLKERSDGFKELLENIETSLQQK